MATAPSGGADDGPGAAQEPCVGPYLARLGLGGLAEKPPGPTLEFLRQVTAAHLDSVPFENLELHRRGGAISLEPNQLFHKIVTRGRGGFCFELNGLLSIMLPKLGYAVRRVPSYVHGENGFQDNPTHLILLVGGLEGRPPEEVFFVDVGFGEPAIEPLRYEIDQDFQLTAEGFRSRFISGEDDHVVLEWELDSGEPAPRLRWRPVDTARLHEGPTLDEFQPMCDLVTSGSIFTQKMIMTRLTEKTKFTLAGTKLKVTTPRVGGVKQEIPLVEEPEDVAKEMAQESAARQRADWLERASFALRAAMQEHFGVALEESEDLDLGATLSAPSGIWGHL